MTSKECCAHCGAEIDGLRAPAMRFTAQQRYVFCSRAHADLFAIPVPEEAKPAATVIEPRAPLAKPAENPAAALDVEFQAAELAASVARAGQEAEAPLSSLHPGTDRAGSLVSPPKGRGQLTAQFSATKLAGTHGVVRRFLDKQFSIAFCLLLLAAALAFWSGKAPWDHLASACIFGTAALVFSRFDSALRSQGEEQLRPWQQALSPGQISEPTGQREPSKSSFRSGELLTLSAGDPICVDAVVVDGEAVIRPWPGAEQPESVRTDSRVLAGAHVLEGSLRLLVEKTGEERAFASLVRGLDSPLVTGTWPNKWARQLSSYSAAAGAALGVAAYFVSHLDLAGSLGLGAVFWAALSFPAFRLLPARIVHFWLLKAASRGIYFVSAAAVDRASEATAAVLCARGTVLHGAPEVTEIHGLRGQDEAQVLALAAGAESVVRHPIATSVARAASLRGVSPDSCRGHRVMQGRGIICVASSGELLVVGSRELLLEQRVSIALAEETLRNLETRGLSALLVAKDERLVGILALQDAIRGGSRATIQLLLDEGVEPILLSADARNTTEALGRALACDHVRPEVPGNRRAAEVRSLGESGAVVAVIGSAERDQSALAASALAIVLGDSAGLERGAMAVPGVAVVCASGQVITAAHALMAARRARRQGQLLLFICFGPVLLSLLAAMSQLLPPFFAAGVAAGCAFLASWVAKRLRAARSIG